MFPRWLSKLVKWAGRKCSSAERFRLDRSVVRPLFRPMFEQLEGRIVPSVDPFVQSINRTSPASALTGASSVAYTVTFNEAVTGVVAADFNLAVTGSVTATVSQVTAVSGSVYTVTVSGITGAGTLGLNLVDNGTIRDLAGDTLAQASSVSFQSPMTFATGAPSDFVAVADVNGDGKPDLIVANNGYAKPNSTMRTSDVGVLLGNGNGTFQQQTTFATGFAPNSVTVADVTGNGKLDLVVANGGNDGVSVLLGNGNGTFQHQATFATGGDPLSVAVADVNGDGKPDLIVHYDGGVDLLLGNGNGTFQSQKTIAARFPPANNLVVADLTGNGKPDIIFADGDSVAVMLGNGNGTFQTPTTFATTSNTDFVAVADVNGDGIPDLVALTSGLYGGDSINVLLGNGNGTFQSPIVTLPGYDPFAVAVADINGDGKPDLVITNDFGKGLEVMLGNGNGTFQRQQTVAVPGWYFGPVTLADVNGDGKPDIVGGSAIISVQNVVVVLNSTNGDFAGQLYTKVAVPYLVANTTATVTAGNAAVFTVTAYAVSGNIFTGFTGTVHFSVSDTGAGSAIPSDYTFVPADGGVHVFTVGPTLVSLGTQTVTVTDTTTGATAGSATINVVPAAAATLTLTAPTMVNQGVPFSVTVTARDSFGNIAAGYTGQVSFATSDPAARPPVVLPATYTFVAGDRGVHVFDFGVTLITIGAGSQTLTVADNNRLTDTDTIYLPSSWPFVESIDRTTPAGTVTNAASLAYTVTFNKTVTGVNAGDFQLATTGTVAATVSQVTPVSDSVYTVTVTVTAGSGTLGLDLVDNGGIRDLAGNRLTQQNAPPFQTEQTFATTPFITTAVAIGDLTGDGNQDLVVANGGFLSNQGNTVSVLLGNGNGTFQAEQTYAVDAEPESVALADVNGDGKPDIIVANRTSDTVSVLLGNGNGTFQAQLTFATGDHPYSVAVGEVNGDGIPDLVVANSSSNCVSVLLGNGNGTFQAQQTFATGYYPDSVARRRFDRRRQTRHRHR